MDAISYANLRSFFESEPTVDDLRGMNCFAAGCALFSAFVHAKE